MTPRLRSKFFLLSSVLAVASVACAQDYFPLAMGNQWVYKSRGVRSDKTLAFGVSDTASMAGNTWYLLKGLPTGDYWLRSTEDGRILQYDTDAQQEKTWYNFSTPVNQEYNSALPGCCGATTTILSRAATYEGAIGTFGNALEVYYPGATTAGVSNEKFLPYVGPVYRVEQNGGPASTSYDLSYARLNSFTFVEPGALRTSLTIDSATYPQNGTLFARLSVRNTTDTPLRIVFASGQTYDFVIRNELGAEMYRWSTGKAFTMVLRIESLLGEHNYPMFIPLTVPPGHYTLEANLVTDRSSFSAKTAFDVTAPAAQNAP